MIGALFGDLWPYLIAAVTILAGLYGAKKKSECHKQAETKAKEADYENAADIRDRVEHGPDERMREAHDDAGWRD